MNRVDRNPSFHKFLIIWAGQFLSMVGSGLTGFALGVYAFERTGKATWAALVTFLRSAACWRTASTAA
jgi:hypothetical protein